MEVHPNPAEASVEAPAAQAQPGVLSRIGNAARNAWETVTRHPKEILAIGAASFACAQAAELVFSADPVAASGTATATASSLKQKCGKDIFTAPQIIDDVMNNPGKRTQSIQINLGFGQVDPACDGHFTRQALIMPQLVRHGHIVNENPTWTPLLKKNPNDSTTAGILDFNSANEPKRYWRPGDKARFLLRLQERNSATHKLVKTVTETKPIKIKR